MQFIDLLNIVKTEIKQQKQIKINAAPACLMNKFYLSIKKIQQIIKYKVITKTGQNKDQSNQQNHKGLKLGYFALRQSIDLLIAPNGLPDIYIGTQITIKIVKQAINQRKDLLMVIQNLRKYFWSL
ncbi:hypothetical protein ABPG72_011396 [Tetrahymena utriculariae]